MKTEENKLLAAGVALLAAFAVWTLLMVTEDVKPDGPGGSAVGFAALNCWFHQLTGIHMSLYIITDWLGLVPVAVCIIFAWPGLVQLIKRRSLFRVDFDIILLGGYIILLLQQSIFYLPLLFLAILRESYATVLMILILVIKLLFRKNML